MKMEETNVHLIEECRRGNRTAQLALYKQFAQRLYVACLRIVGNVPEAEEAIAGFFPEKYSPAWTSIGMDNVSKHGCTV